MSENSLDHLAETNVSSVETESIAMQSAGFGRRACAYLFDYVIVVLLSGIVFSVAFGAPGQTANDSASEDLWFALIWMVVMLAYTTALEGGAWAATLGKLVFGAKVVSRTEDEFGLARSIQRNLLKLLISQLFLGFGFWMALFRKDHLAFHDLAPKTAVVLRRSPNAAGPKVDGDQAMGHSKLAIASFITSIVSGVSIIVLFVVAGVLASTPEGLDENSAASMVIGLMLFALLFASLVALGLGIAGLFNKRGTKMFAIVGITVSAATLTAAISVLLAATEGG